MKAIPKMNSYALQPVGFIRSTVKGREDAPRQGTEGAPDAWLEIEPRFAEALLGMEVGHDGFANRWLVGSGSVYETASKMACRIRLRSWDHWRIERSESGYSSGVVSNSVDSIS